MLITIHYLNYMQIKTFCPDYEEDEERLNEQIVELGLKVNSGDEFVLDRRELDVLLNHTLSYPSTEKVEYHCNSNKLGQFDYNKDEKYRKINDNEVKVEEQVKKICCCCGFILQEKDLDVCQNKIKEINSLGISTYVYFRTIFNVTVLLAIMFIIYSLYSIASNIYASQLDIEGNNSNSMLKYLSISLGSKEMFSSGDKQRLYVIGAWIGCAMLVTWGFVFMSLKYHQKEDQVKILMDTKTAAEYSLVIEKMPTGLTLEEVQQQFTKYLAKLKAYDSNIVIEHLQVEKYNQGKPFYFQEEEFKSNQLKKVMKNYENYKQLFISWILQRRCRDTFSASETYRKRKYEQYKKVVKNKSKICEEIIEKIKQQYKKKNKENKTTVFITFGTNRQKNLILDYNPQDMISRIKDYIPFLRNQNRFFIERKGIIYNLKIFPAPDPEDVVWTNIGVTSCQKIARKILTFTITMIILAISFVIVYSLSTTQNQNQGNFYLSILISLSISIVNVLIIQVIQILTKYERDYTMTNYQTSLAIKSITAQVLNTIFVPFMAAYFIKKNVYGPNGLIEDVFILAITNSFVPPFLKMFDIYYFFRVLYSKFKLQPCQKIRFHQFEINELCERMQFEVGYEYIYIINLFIFTCFYVSLQPIIPIIAIVGLVCMHWAQKYSLFHRCQRPVPGTKILNTTMSQLIYFGAVAYSLGSLTWANFLPQSDHQFESSIPPNLLSASIAFTIFVLPYQMIFRKCFANKRMPEMFYFSNRVFFTSEYDRLNPSTAESGIKQYRQFLETKRKQLDDQTPQAKSRLSLQLQLNNRPNFFKQTNNGLFVTFRKSPEEAIYDNLISRQAQNILTPQMIANVIMPNKMSVSRTNFKPHLFSIPQLHKNRSTLPRRAAEFEGESVIKNNYLEPPVSREKLANIHRVESINFDNMKNHDDKPEELQESKVQKYLPDVSNVKSFIVKIEEDPQQQSQVSYKDALKANKSNKVQRGKPRHDKDDSSNLAISQHKKSSFRESMIKQLSASLRCNEEVPNRFSINAQNIIPLCIDDKEDINFGQSLIKFYELGDFQ